MGGERETGREHACERERPLALWLLFLHVFSPPPEAAVCKLGQPGGLFVLPEVLTLVPLFYFHRLFPSLSFSPRHSGLLFPILTT